MTPVQAAEQALRQGQTDAALKSLQDGVRAQPANAKLRVFLFQLLCVIGQWPRALNQLEVCGAGSCACRPGFVECDGQCVNLGTDPDHCGFCGTSCDQVCGGGACLNNCDDFQDQCGDSCFDQDSDPLHCGECGNACDADETCLNGDCRRFTLAGCDQCPCDGCGDAQCCESQFLDVAVCLQGGGGGGGGCG